MRLRNFTGNASHQLRTPLAVVRTQLALIDRSTGPERRPPAPAKRPRPRWSGPNVCCRNFWCWRVSMPAPVQAMLGPVDLAGLAKEVTSEMVPAAITQDIDLGYEGIGHVMVAAEPVLLAELLRNLLSNAIRYAGRGAVVTVRVQKIADRIVLEVEDNGPGLSDAPNAAAAALGRRGPQQRRHISPRVRQMAWDWVWLSRSKYHCCSRPSCDCNAQVQGPAFWHQSRSKNLPNDRFGPNASFSRHGPTRHGRGSWTSVRSVRWQPKAQPRCEAVVRRDASAPASP